MIATSTYPFAQGDNGEDISLGYFLSTDQQQQQQHLQQQLRLYIPSQISTPTSTCTSSVLSSPMKETTPTTVSNMLVPTESQQIRPLGVNNSMGSAPKLIEQSQAPDCLVILQIASTGKQGSNLGSDESSVALISAKLFNVNDRSVSHVRTIHLSQYGSIIYIFSNIMKIRM